MRVLGVDFGLKRIGLALSDEGGTIAQPLKYIDGGGIAVVSREVARIGGERKVGKIVVGVPVRVGWHAERANRAHAGVHCGIAARHDASRGKMGRATDERASRTRVAGRKRTA